MNTTAQALLFQNHPGAYIGPLVLSATIQGFNTGLVLNFAYRFWRDDFYPTRRYVHLVMILVTCLVLFVLYFQTLVLAVL